MGKKSKTGNGKAVVVAEPVVPTEAVSAEEYMKARKPQSELVVLPKTKVAVRVKTPSVMDGVRMFQALDVNPEDTAEMSDTEMGAIVFKNFEPVIEKVLPQIMLEPRIVPSSTPPNAIPPNSVRVCDLDEDDLWFLVMHVLGEIGGDEAMVEAFQNQPGDGGSGKSGKARRRRTPSK